ncbi:unnamed protein product [Acanthosepion pharaonis]|uniref:Uncharacterized protein n=1 Tax=Acanthosepion pharaonis TaxID=158019 RepID=A0A812ES47_ACAPH|nr:unnamed protein product [Sepia pharaonis]
MLLKAFFISNFNKVRGDAGDVFPKNDLVNRSFTPALYAYPELDRSQFMPYLLHNNSTSNFCRETTKNVTNSDRADASVFFFLKPSICVFQHLSIYLSIYLSQSDHNYLSQSDHNYLSQSDNLSLSISFSSQLDVRDLALDGEAAVTIRYEVRVASFLLFILFPFTL